MSTLASLVDVKRILRIPATDVDTDRDAQLQGALDAVEAWASKRLAGISKEGAGIEVYWDVGEDATLRLPASDVTITTLKVYEYPSSNGVPLSPIQLGLGHGYEVTDGGDLILRPMLFVSPFEGATAWRRLRHYDRVEVHYIGTGVIPRAVTEGIAFLAAGYWKDGPRALLGLTSEKIGDYSYTLGNTGGATGQPEYVAQALFFLNDYFRKARVSVV